jgi:hypothetical protein
MHPANWGPATATMHAIHRDGVDIGDSGAVDEWIARQNAGAFGGGAVASYDAESVTWDDADLKAASRRGSRRG